MTGMAIVDLATGDANSAERLLEEATSFFGLLVRGSWRSR